MQKSVLTNSPKMLCINKLSKQLNKFFRALQKIFRVASSLTSSLHYLYRFFVVYFTQMFKNNNLLEVLYKSLILQQIKLVAIYTDDNDLDCREFFTRTHSKIDEILSLVFKDFGTVLVLIQMLPNITLGCFNFDFFMKIWSHV